MAVNALQHYDPSVHEVRNAEAQSFFDEMSADFASCLFYGRDPGYIYDEVGEVPDVLFALDLVLVDGVWQLPRC